MAASVVTEPAATVSSTSYHYEVPPAPPALETSEVREIQPRETAPMVAAPSGPGFAVATPIQIEWPSDLQQVESDPDKIRAAEQEGAQQQSASRPKRVRPPQAPASDEPLVQVETGKQEAAAEEGTPTLPG